MAKSQKKKKKKTEKKPKKGVMLSQRPRIGQMVHYYESGTEKPRAAIVAEVLGDDTVQLAVFDWNGSEFSARGPIPLGAPADPKPRALTTWEYPPE